MMIHETWAFGKGGFLVQFARSKIPNTSDRWIGSSLVLTAFIGFY
jgi:hypothetical protein